MSDWIWVPLPTLHIIHDRQIARHGGASGTRDPALLEMGCARALNRAAYEDADLFEIVAAYAYGIAKAHAHAPTSPCLRPFPKRLADRIVPCGQPATWPPRGMFRRAT